jgi:hypothetical protein
MKNRNFTDILKSLYLFGVITIFLGIAQLVTIRDDIHSDTKEDSMNLAYALETNSMETPQIDAAAPAVFETASFGLG